MNPARSVPVILFSLGTTMTKEIASIARELKRPVKSIQAAVQLLDEGNTIPFITRFRKDETGGLDESQLQQIKQQVARYRAIEERRQFILKSIESQGKLDADLKKKIESARESRQLEDLYLPFKPKKQTLATAARQQGLEPLANDIFEGRSPDVDLATRAIEFVRVDKGLSHVDEVIKGVGHILAERFADRGDVRAALRELVWSLGELTSTSPTASKSPTPAPATPAPATPSTPVASPAPVASPDPTPSAVPAPSEPVDATSTIEPKPNQPKPTEPVPAAQIPPSDPIEEEEEEEEVADTEPGPDEETEIPPADAVASDEALAMSGEESGENVKPSSAEPETKPAPEPEPAAQESTSSPSKPKPKRKRLNKKKNKKKAKKEHHNPYKDYHDFRARLKGIPHHRVLAINRGERAGKLKVKVVVDDGAIVDKATEMLVADDHPFAPFLKNCVRDGMMRLMLPSLEREVRRELTEKAERHAVQVFARNLRQLLLQSPVTDRVILAIDPGLKRGCSIAVLDPCGRLLDQDHLFAVGSQQRQQVSIQTLVDKIKRHSVEVIAIGNGAGSRETEQLVSDVIASHFADSELRYALVNEAGASHYSTSEVGREELPEVSPKIRSAISIGRRLIDPLSELVKISPANIGVGMYQHDIKAKHLSESLDEVVQFCVNQVGVNVNTASPALLKYVSGLNQLTARRIYEHRVEHGPFRNRQELKKVTGFGEATFVQAAGFLRIRGGDQPLDSTSIHPESYPLVDRILEKVNGSIEELIFSPPDPPADESSAPTTSPSPTGSASAKPSPEYLARQRELVKAIQRLDFDQLASEFGVGRLLVQDLVRVLCRPEYDPRHKIAPPVLRKGILKFDSLQPGMQLQAQVVNVVDFGLFVDIGLNTSCLVHVSQLAPRFIHDPHLFYSIGDVLEIWVLEVDMAQRRVNLTAIPPGTPRERSSRRRNDRGGRGQQSSRGQRRGKGGDRRAPRRQPRRKPKPVTPISEEMLKGEAPMRSFSDLAQFFNKRPDTPEKDQD